MLEDIITLWLALGMSCLLKSQNIEARTPRPTGKMEQAAVITLVKPESHANRRKVKLVGGARRRTTIPSQHLGRHWRQAFTSLWPPLLVLTEGG